MSKERKAPTDHANDFQGEIKDGRDGKQYISRSDKNGVYHWKRFYSPGESKTAYKYYSQFDKFKEPKYDRKEVVGKLKSLSKDLAKEGIHMKLLGWDGIWDFIDNAWDDVQEEIGKEIGEESVIFTTDYRLYWASVDSKLSLQHDVLQEDAPVVIKLFHKYFGKRVEIPMSRKRISSTKTINIKLKKL